MNKQTLIAIAVVVAGLALWLLYVILSAPAPANTVVKSTAILRQPQINRVQTTQVASRPTSDSVKTSVNVVSGNLNMGVTIK